MLPIFISTYQRAVSSNIRKIALSLIRKMTHYASPEHLKEVAKTPGVQEGFSDVVSTALDQEVCCFGLYNRRQVLLEHIIQFSLN